MLYQQVYLQHWLLQMLGHLIWKNASTGDIRHSSIGYSCNSGGYSGKPKPFFMEGLRTLPCFIAKWHVLHNHSLLLTQVKPFEHCANMFCSICALGNNLLTSYTDDLNHVCKQTVHTHTQRPIFCFLIE